MGSTRQSTDASLWSASAGEVPASTPFEAGRRFDAVVVGGGVAGAASAHALAAGGAEVALLEAGRPGCGATGRSAGFIVPAFAKASPGDVIDRLGETGERLVRLVAASAQAVFSLVSELDIVCDARQGGWFQPARSASALKVLEENARLYAAAGAGGSLLDAGQTEQATGMRGYAGCWRADTGGTLHPVRFVNGLIARGMERGLHFFPGTEAGSLRRADGRWRVGTAKGELCADTVLVCTNARSPGLHATLSRSVVPVQVCQIATEPIAEEARRHLLGQGQCLTDTRVNLFSYRFDPEWRLITGLIPSLPPGDGRRLARKAAARLQRELALPSLPEAQYAWLGIASVTGDLLPQVHDLGPGAYAVTACNGRGLAVSTVVGRSLARSILEPGKADLPFAVTPLRPLPGRGLRSLGARLYPFYGMIKDGLNP